jgi:polar amino acid transport system substrate-binding protein
MTARHAPSGRSAQASGGPWRRLLVALVLSLSFASRPAAAGQGVARVKGAGVLRWGGDKQGGEPFVYDDPERPGHLRGFEVDLADALARELGVRAEFVQNDWANLVPSLERGTFDVIMNGLEVTEARVGRVLFTRPYFVFAERLMARRNDPSVTIDLRALAGRRVGTLAGSLGFELLRASKAETVVYDGVEEPYVDLQHGRIDAVLLDDIIATRYGAPKGELRVVGDVRDGYYALGVRADEPDLAAALDAALGAVASRGELRTILERHRLWSDRQARLAAWSAPDQAQMLGRPPPPPAFGGVQVVMFVKAALVTLVVSALAMVVAMALGVLLAVARRFGGPLARGLAGAYVELYRGTPVLLQLYVLYYGLAPVLRIGALPAAVLGLGMNYAAYEAEVYRAGIQAVPRDQLEAALALGMRTPLAFRRVVFPQALRYALPNVANDFIALLKDSSLVSAITVVELTKQMTITAVDVRGWLVPGAACAALYFAMSYPLGRVARRLERKLEGERARAPAEGRDVA